MGGNVHFYFGIVRDYSRACLAGHEPNFPGRNFNRQAPRLDDKFLPGDDGLIYHFGLDNFFARGDFDEVAEEINAVGFVKLFLAFTAATDGVFPPKIRGRSRGARRLQRVNRGSFKRSGGDSCFGFVGRNFLSAAPAPIQRDADADWHCVQFGRNNHVLRDAA